MWPFPQHQFKPAGKGEVRMRIQEHLQQTPRLASGKHRVRRRQKRQPLLSPNQAPGRTVCGAPSLCLLLPKFRGKHAKQSTRWFPFWRKTWNRIQTAAEVTRGRGGGKTALWKRRASSRKHARQAEWLQGRARRDVEKSSWNVNFLLYSSNVLLRSQDEETSKDPKTCRSLTSKLKGSTERMRGR